MPKKVPALNAQFQPELWVDDHILPVGQAVAFDAGPTLLAMSAGDLRKIDIEIRKDSGRDLDMVAYIAGVTQAHSGPFRVNLDLADYLCWLEAVGFNPNDVVSVDDSFMEKIRTEYGVQAYVPSGLNLLAATTIKDWRVGDAAGEEDLSERQKLAWPVRFYQGAGGGIELEFDAPDGSQRIVAFEIDKGNLKILPHRDRGVDLDAIVLMEPDRVLISHYAHGGKAVAFHEGGVDRAVENDPTPSFGDDATPRPG